MNILETLIACEGSWQGANTLHDPSTGKPEASPSTATIVPVARGKFIRLDYTWAYQGRPQEGSLLIGFELKTSVATGYWIDSWHMGTQLLICEAKDAANPPLALVGSYPAPPGPDWHWRIEIHPQPEALHVRMFNIWPNHEKEEPAAEATYQR